MSATDDVELLVRSDVTPAGTYVVSVSCGPELAFTLNREQALRYASAAIATAEHAKYDAAVLHLLTTSRADDNPGKKMLSMTAAAMFVRSELSQDRTPLDMAATAPLEFRPNATPKGTPFIVVMAAGERFGQLNPRELRNHALDVLSTSVIVDLDAHLYRTLRASIALNEQQARRIVGDMLHFRNIASELSEQP